MGNNQEIYKLQLREIVEVGSRLALAREKQKECLENGLYAEAASLALVINNLIDERGLVSRAPV